MKEPVHWYVIINPAAGNGRAYTRWQHLKRLLEANAIVYTEAVSEFSGHVCELAGKALSRDFTHFISVGGDGSHHELVNGLLNASAQNPIKPVVAILSAGSGNDWARSFNISPDVRKCFKMLHNGKQVVHPAAKINFSADGSSCERHFINVAGMALDGKVVETFPQAFRKIPLIPGYLFAGLWHLLTYRAPMAQIDAGETAFMGRFLTINAGIGKYSGGGMQFVPHADVSRSDLALTCVEHMPKWQLLANIYRLYTGSLLAHSRVIGLHATEITVSGDQIPIEADGEFLGYTPARISFVPDAFRLVVP